MEENTMNVDVALPLKGTFAIQHKLMSEFAGGISSLHNSWTPSFPYPFDTMSLPEVRVSMQENITVVFLKIAPEISSARWLNQTVPELVRLLWLPEGWNSDNPERINPRAVEKILMLLLAILESDSPPPIVVPTTRGGIQVEWHQNGIDLEIESFNSSKVEYYFSDSKGEKEGTIEDDPAILKRFTSRLKTSSCSSRV
jgi:hypothetical protein